MAGLTGPHRWDKEGSEGVVKCIPLHADTLVRPYLHPPSQALT